jgi:glycosyltransferase involved in cell wall biosynthesis
MRVAIDASALGSRRGGDETLLRGMLVGLHHVANPSDMFDLFAQPGAPLPPQVSKDPRFLRHAIPSSGGAVRLSLTLPRALRTASFDALLAFTHSPLRTRIPRVLTVTDLSFRHVRDLYPLAVRLRLNTVVPRQARRAEAVATLSEFCRNDLVDSYSLDRSAVFVVPCTVEAPPICDDWRNEAAWAGRAGIRTPFVLYVGNLHPRKNVPRLISAMELARTRFRLPDAYQLVIAGRSWWRTGPEAELARRVPNVVMVGGVTDLQREYLLRSATVLAYLSLFEGFGLPPLEAMIRGTPVLTSSVSSLPEVVSDAALLTDPTDTAAIAAALTRLVNDERLRGELVARGLARARRFTPARTGRALMRALDAAVATRIVKVREGA